MAGLFAVLYGVVTYGVFLFSLLYAVGFVGNFVVPKSIDAGPAGPLVESVAVDVLLLGLFAVQHSVMARAGLQATVDEAGAAAGGAQHLCAVRQRRAG